MLILFSQTLLNGVTLLDPFKSLNSWDQRLMENNKREIYFFNLLFPEALSVEIATQTNEYIRKHIEATPNKNWYPTNPEEIKALIGIQIVMGVLQPPAQDMYWYKDKLFHQSIIEMKFICFSLYH